MKVFAQRLVFLAIGVGLVLLVPWAAMQFTDSVMWNAADFAIAAVLLFGAGSIFLGIAQMAPRRRLLAAAAVLGIVVLIWAELAVGIFGTPWAGS
jgi:hypothetical protein